MGSNKLQIHEANKNEIKILLNLWIEKSKWLIENNKDTWSSENFTEKKLTAQYDKPVYYICCKDQAIIGGFILIEKDTFFWKEKTDNDCFYIHKLMVCNEHNGKGYADNILTWIKTYAKNKGKKYLRLDYDHNRSGIKQLYEKNGFKKVEIIQLPDLKPVTKAEYCIV